MGAKLTHVKLDRMSRTLKAIAHPLRLRIIEALEKGEKNVGDIVAAVDAF